MRKELKAEYDRKYYLKHKEKKAAQSKLWREKNKDKIKSSRVKYYRDNKHKCDLKNKEWARINPDERKAILKKYARSHKGKATLKKANLADRTRYPERHRARNAVNLKIYRGKLKRGTCHCGKVGQAHHEDYTKPLEVIWLCSTHHAEHHRSIV